MKNVFLLLILSVSLHAKPEMWEKTLIDSSGNIFDEQHTIASQKNSQIVNPGGPFFKEIYDHAQAFCKNKAGYVEIAMHDDIKPILIHEIIDQTETSASWKWVWHVRDNGKWLDLWDEATNPPNYEQVLTVFHINPKWKIEDYPISYKKYTKSITDPPDPPTYKIVTVKKFMGWGMNRHERKELSTDVSWMNFLTDISKEKDIKGIQITCDSVYYLQKYYEDVTKTVQVE